MMDFQFQAVGEERLEHVCALAEGEVLHIRDLSGIEFCFEVELGEINPRWAAEDEFAVANSVRQLDQFAKRDVHSGVAVGGRQELPALVGSCGGLDSGNVKGESLSGSG